MRIQLHGGSHTLNGRFGREIMTATGQGTLPDGFICSEFGGETLGNR